MAQNAGFLTPRRALLTLPSDNTSPVVRTFNLNSSLTWQDEEIIRQRGRRSFDLSRVSRQSGQGRRISCRSPFPDEAEKCVDVGQGRSSNFSSKEDRIETLKFDTGRSLSTSQSSSSVEGDDIEQSSSSDFKSNEEMTVNTVSDKRRSFSRRQSLKRL
ncbi:unnamed protein product [Hermetia illucens]|uniref:Uncharacterized protein n=1 Tax=Hermetia illucens TaxID=343691 RepID=A0A7R8USB0_HERIL|nr:unnamed protein product [Hermetia illucens]